MENIIVRMKLKNGIDIEGELVIEVLSPNLNLPQSGIVKCKDESEFNIFLSENRQFIGIYEPKLKYRDYVKYYNINTIETIMIWN